MTNNISQRERWIKDFKNYLKMKRDIVLEMKELKRSLLRKKKDLKWLKKDIKRLERRIYGRN